MFLLCTDLIVCHEWRAQGFWIESQKYLLTWYVNTSWFKIRSPLYSILILLFFSTFFFIYIPLFFFWILFCIRINDLVVSLHFHFVCLCSCFLVFHEQHTAMFIIYSATPWILPEEGVQDGHQQKFIERSAYDRWVLMTGERLWQVSAMTGDIKWRGDLMVGNMNRLY